MSDQAGWRLLSALQIFVQKLTEFADRLRVGAAMFSLSEHGAVAQGVVQRIVGFFSCELSSPLQ